MTPGTQLGPYRIESLIGAGGMGEVYLGVDTRLDRQVAIKILAGALAKDPALRERFEREARTISSLSHPNICTLFDLGRHHDSDYLVMEYLQGETLADRIARGPLPVKEVVRIGLGIAQALEAAHRQGIVHRDLKPGNVMLTKSGVKLLDFGLAKLSVVSSAGHSTVVPTGATEQKPLTEQGTILGTFQYMAPEQLEGLAVDARTDLFALGAILYEMATGRRAFNGATKASLIAAILEREPPPMTELQPLTPPALERIVRACLAKDPNERIQTAHDLALELKWIGESSSTIEPVGVKRRKKLGSWLVAALFGLAALASGALLWRERTKPAPAYTMSILPPEGYEMMPGAVVSPDGALIALSVRNRASREYSLWLRRVDDGSARQLVKNALGPFWSPDGRWIGFYQPPDLIMRVRVEGGQPETICRSNVQSAPAWGEDGTVLFCPGFGHGISRVAASGGEPQPLTKLDASRRESAHVTPLFLPGGKRFLYTSRTIADRRNEVWAASLDGGKPSRVVVADALIGYVKPYLLTVRDGAAYAQRFDPESLEVSGEPQRVVDDVAFFEAEAAAQAAVSPAGTLAYASYNNTRNLVNVYERNGTLAATLWEDDNIGFPALSRDGSTLVVSKFDRTKGATDLYAVDLARKVATRLTTGLAGYFNPEISPDGQTLAFHSDRNGLFDIYLHSLDGSSADRLLWKSEQDKWVGSWTPDGRNLLVSSYSSEMRGDIWVVPVDGGKPWPYLQTEGFESDATISPDGKWVAYLVTQGAEDELFVRPFPKGRAYRVSTDGAAVASWGADGRELVWASKGRILSAALDLSAPTPKIGRPQELFRLPQVWSAPKLLRDGRIAVIVPRAGDQTELPLHVTTAWRMKMEQ